jgi:hypothetical protein
MSDSRTSMSVTPRSPTERRGRGKAKKTIELIEAARRILEVDQPTTVRAVCYRLFVAGVIDSMSKTNTAMVSRNLVTAREEGTIPWGWIVDETRTAERVATWDDPDEIIETAVNGYRKDYWIDQPAWIEIWSEKGTVRGALSSVLNEYGLTFRVMHGFGSATSINAVAAATADSDKPLTILYIGDYDPSGLYMSEVDLPERFKRYGGRASITRIALTAADVHSGDLPSFEAATKTGDPRHKWFLRNFGKRCWELDAMPAPALRRRVEGEVLRRLDQGRWHHAKQVERAEIESMQAVMAGWQASISRLVQENLDGGEE